VVEVSLIPVFILLAEDWLTFESVALALVSKCTAAVDVLELPDFGGATTVGVGGWLMASFASLGLVMLLLVFGLVFGLVCKEASGWTL